MPDEAIYAVRGLGLWQHGSLPLFGSSGAGYSALYPVFAGAPLSIGSHATGYVVLKAVQAFVMSLAAWPVYTYTRRLVPDGYALLAAALTLACPLVLFSGFVMTEVLYYPIAAAALLATARAVATTALTDQGIALVLIASGGRDARPGRRPARRLRSGAARGCRTRPSVARAPPVLADLGTLRGRSARRGGAPRRVRRV